MANYKLFNIYHAEKDFVERFMAELREDDRRELLAITDNIEREIMESITFSAECFCATTNEDEPIVLFGRVMLPERDGAMIWCLGTDRLKKYWFPFLRESRKILHEWAHDFNDLYNVVASFNTVHMRWLSWLGAKFGEEIKRNGEVFIRFNIAKEDI